MLELLHLGLQLLPEIERAPVPSDHVLRLAGTNTQASYSWLQRCPSVSWRSMPNEAKRTTSSASSVKSGEGEKVRSSVFGKGSEYNDYLPHQKEQAEVVCASD